MATKNKHLVLKAGLGIAAVAAAAGAYYFLGKDGKKHRKSAVAWMNKAKTDVVSELKKMKNVTEKTYAQAVSKVMTKYKKFEKTHPEELKALKAKFAGDWKKIQKHLPKSVKAAVRVGRKLKKRSAAKKA